MNLFLSEWLIDIRVSMSTQPPSSPNHQVGLIYDGVTYTLTPTHAYPPANPPPTPQPPLPKTYPQPP